MGKSGGRLAWSAGQERDSPTAPQRCVSVRLSAFLIFQSACFAYMCPAAWVRNVGNALEMSDKFRRRRFDVSFKSQNEIYYLCCDLILLSTLFRLYLAKNTTCIRKLLFWIWNADGKKNHFVWIFWTKLQWLAKHYYYCWNKTA